MYTKEQNIQSTYSAQNLNMQQICSSTYSWVSVKNGSDCVTVYSTIQAKGAPPIMIAPIKPIQEGKGPAPIWAMYTRRWYKGETFANLLEF